MKKSPRLGRSRKDLMNCSCSHQSSIRGLCEAAVCRLFLCRFICFMKWPNEVFSRTWCLYRNVTTRISLLLSPITIGMSLSCPFTTILVALVFIVSEGYISLCSAIQFTNCTRRNGNKRRLQYLFATTGMCLAYPTFERFLILSLFNE